MRPPAHKAHLARPGPAPEQAEEPRCRREAILRISPAGPSMPPCVGHRLPRESAISALGEPFALQRREDIAETAHIPREEAGRFTRATLARAAGIRPIDEPRPPGEGRALLPKVDSGDERSLRLPGSTICLRPRVASSAAVLGRSG